MKKIIPMMTLVFPFNMLTDRCRWLMSGLMLLLLLPVTMQRAIAQCLTNNISINTGQHPGGGSTIIPGFGLQDTKWEVTYVGPGLPSIVAPNTPVYNAYVVTPDAFWITNANSEWIAIIPSCTYTTTGAASFQDYKATFRRSFTTCEDDDITFYLDIANDNYCPEIRVDGVPVPAPTPFSQPSGPWAPPYTMMSHYTGFTTISPFTIGLLKGVHTIEIDVVNVEVDGDNPHGLNIVGNLTSVNNSLVDEHPACLTYNCCNPNFDICISSSNPYQVDFAADDNSLPSSAYTWEVDGTYAGTGSTLSHPFITTGYHLVKLTIVNPYTSIICPMEKFVCIEGKQLTGDQCDLDFTFCYNTFYPYTYDFSSSNTSLPSSAYSWTVNGVSAGTGPTLNHNFGYPGTFEICLKMVDGNDVCEKCLEICIADNGAFITNNKDKSADNGTIAKAGSKNSTSIFAIAPSKFEVLKVYPNPAHDVLNINLANAGKEQVSIRIYDMFGKLAMEHTSLTPRNHKVSIATDRLAAGMYMLEISNGITTKREKIAIE